MKKLFICTVICLTLLLTGCESDSELSTINIKETSSKIDQKFSNMSDVSESEIKDIYEVDLSLVNEYVFKTSDSGNGDIYIILNVNESNKNEVRRQIKKYFNTLEEQVEVYSPDVVKKIKNRLETEIGDNLIYVSSSNNEEIFNIIKDSTN